MPTFVLHGNLVHFAAFYPTPNALEVYDFIGYLKMKREKDTEDQIDIENLSMDEQLIRQVQRSREDRRNGRIYCQEQGLKYLRKKIVES
jgi:hypothetical protein